MTIGQPKLPKIGDCVFWLGCWPRPEVGRVTELAVGKVRIRYPNMAGVQELPLACLRQTADGWEVVE